jgi:hypothetical protein
VHFIVFESPCADLNLINPVFKSLLISKEGFGLLSDESGQEFADF